MSVPLLLSVHSAKRGGAERMALHEASYLKHGFELVIAVPEGPLRDGFATHGELVEGTPSLPLWGAPAHRWAARCARTVRHAVRLAAFIRRRGIRVVLTNSSVSLAPVLAARMAHVPALVHVRDVPGSRLAPWVFRVHGLLAETVITISGAQERYFRPTPRARVALIPEGVALGPLPPNGNDPQFGAPLRLCLVGGIDRRKGQDVAVDAMSRLGEHGVDAVLELVGRDANPEFAAKVHARVRELGLDERIRFTGEADDIDGVLARNDILLAPSRGEWTPLVVMEALAHAKPVVASGVGGMRDLVVSGETGLLTPPEDSGALATAIAGLAADPAAARAMGRRGRARIASDFSLSGSLEALRREIDRALAA